MLGLLCDTALCEDFLKLPAVILPRHACSGCHIRGASDQVSIAVHLHVHHAHGQPFVAKGLCHICIPSRISGH